jgi:hypothetical protein
MFRAKRLRVFVLLLVAISFLGLEVSVSGSKDKKQSPKGTPVLWKQPSNISSRDLFEGPGGAAMRPDLRQLTFLKQETGGYSKKYRVRDASGHEWVAKVGKEAQPETAAVRLLWGIGYLTEVNYLVPRVTIPGKGTFTNVRFEARPDEWKRVEEWKWGRNPFVGTPEFQGLKIMMALINNWDIKDSNNQIVFVKDSNESRYIISDLGATFGHASTTPLFWRFTRSRNNPDNYSHAEFLEKVKGNRVVLHYGGKNRGLFKNITVQDANWIADLLSQLSDRQIRDAFRAANYTPSQINLLAQTVRSRTNELRGLQPSMRINRTQSDDEE